MVISLIGVAVRHGHARTNTGQKRSGIRARFGTCLDLPLRFSAIRSLRRARLTGDVGPHRQTRYRNEVLTLLLETTEFLGAQRVHTVLRGRGSSIGLTTVYRVLQVLADEGIADCIRAAAGEQVYRRCGSDHHHHLMCRTCGRAIEIENPAIERWAAEIAEHHEFRDVGHSIEIFGTCSVCAAADRSPAA
jgi:Fur family ferric uptake transcriptional regulator